jgi:L-rhamnose isomerase/sugar isomerase
LKQAASRFGLGFDAMNSNTFADAPGQVQSYKFGSLSHAASDTRRQAVEHNLECIEIGKTIGSRALTVWIGDGSNFPGQVNFTTVFEHYLDSMRQIYDALPDDWKLYTEHKMYEPAFYSTVVQDWGTNYLIASELGDKAMCLVDLGHHAPNVNIEQIVARLIQFEKLGGFHFNDSKYGDDDLDTGSIAPFRLFLVFNELVDAELRRARGFAPAHMLDQSHNVTDPIESLIRSANEVRRAYAQALLVDRKALVEHQRNNDAILASEALKNAFRTDVEPILAMARLEAGGAVHPIRTYRAAGYRRRVAEIRPPVTGGGGGIV